MIPKLKRGNLLLGTEKKLFKDRINKTDTAILAKELLGSSVTGKNDMRRK